MQPLDFFLLSASPSSIQVVLVVDTPTMVPCFAMLCHVLSCSALSCPALTLPYLAMLCYAFSCHCCNPHCHLCASALSSFSQYPFVSIVVLILRPLPTLCRALTTMIGGEIALKHCSNTFSVRQRAPFCGGSDSFFVLFRPQISSHILQLLDASLFLTSLCSVLVVLTVDVPTKTPCFIVLCYVSLCPALSCLAVTLPCIVMLCCVFCHCCSPCYQPLCASALSCLSHCPFISNLVFTLQPLPALCCALTTTIGGESSTLMHCSNTFSVRQ